MGKGYEVWDGSGFKENTKKRGREERRDGCGLGGGRKGRMQIEVESGRNERGVRIRWDAVISKSLH